MLGASRCILLAGVLVGACGGRTEFEQVAVGPRCEPGHQVACDCARGAGSVQVCGDDFRYGPCQCSPVGNGGAAGAGGSRNVGGAGGFGAVGAGGGFGSGSAGTGGGDSAGAGGMLGNGGGAGSALIDYRYGDTAPCDVAMKSIFFDGDTGDFIHPGQDLISIARFTDSSSRMHVNLDIEPSGQQHGLWWWVDFSSDDMDQPLVVGEYLNAERYPFQSYLKPGLDVSGDGRGCNTLTGKFKISDIRWIGGTLVRFVAAFEQHCEGVSAALRGCVHYETGDWSPDGGADETDAIANVRIEQTQDAGAAGTRIDMQNRARVGPRGPIL
jgi:hypothetical protein